MSEIIIVGVGPGPWELLTVQARDLLENADKVFFRYGTHPVFARLEEMGKEVIAFELLYAAPNLSYQKAYELMTKAIVREAQMRGRAIYALPGNPFVFEKTPQYLKAMAEPLGIGVRVLPGMSFMELIYIELGVDPEEGLTILNASRMVEAPELYPPNPGMGLLVGQVGLPVGGKPTSRKFNLEPLAALLLKIYPSSHTAIMVRCVGFPTYHTESREVKLSKLAQQTDFINNLTSLYLPPL